MRFYTHFSINKVSIKIKGNTNMKSKILIPAVLVGIIAIATLSSANLANANDFNSSKDSLVTKIATKFNLNEQEVSETFEEFRTENRANRQEKKQEMFQARLNSKVEDGTITQEQEFAMLQKHEELMDSMDDMYDLSPEERQEKMADIHEEMQAWAEENGIEMDEFDRFGKEFSGRGGGHMWR